LFSLPNAQFQPDDTLNPYQQMLQWNTIGLAYEKITQYDSAFMAFQKSFQFAQQMNAAFWMGILKGNMGDVYFDLGQYDSAYALLQFDYDQSIAQKQYDNAANSLQWIARIDVKGGRSMEAMEKIVHCPKASPVDATTCLPGQYLFAFSQLYTRLGQADSVNMYLQKYLHLHDSLEAQVTKSRTDVLQLQLNNLNQVQTIKNLNRDKRQIARTRNYSIVLVVLLACLGYMWLNRLRLKMQMRQRTAQEGQRLAEAETKRATELLDTFRQHLVEKNMLIEKMQTDFMSKDITEDHTGDYPN
jgi:tetratricopeptide (TPR) repeat protein